MRKRLPLLAAIVVGVALLGTIGLLSRGFAVSVGYCVIADNGSCLLVLDDSPIVLSRKNAGEDPWIALSTGDKLLVVHDGINESYPGQTRAYFHARLEQGDPSNIPQEVMSSLAELGWIRVQDDI